MINLKADNEDSFDEYKAAVKRKDNSGAKSELLSIETAMKDCYNNYAFHFEKNDLECMPEARVGKWHKDVLLGMYGADFAIIKNFRKRYFSLNPQTYNNLCPYCTLNEANTTEHILPKEKFPEYSVDTLNLIPACSACNSKKSDAVLNSEGKKFTINFYTDKLPNIQYLFVDFKLVGDDIKAIYRLDNPYKIDSELFALIERHFKRFNLLERFDLKALQETSELINLYLSEEISDSAQFDMFAAKQIRKINLDRIQLGFNHWKIILYFSAATSNVFRKYILETCKSFIK